MRVPSPATDALTINTAKVHRPTALCRARGAAALLLATAVHRVAHARSTRSCQPTNEFKQPPQQQRADTAQRTRHVLLRAQRRQLRARRLKLQRQRLRRAFARQRACAEGGCFFLQCAELASLPWRAARESCVTCTRTSARSAVPAARRVPERRPRPAVPAARRQPDAARPRGASGGGTPRARRHRLLRLPPALPRAPAPRALAAPTTRRWRRWLAAVHSTTGRGEACAAGCSAVAAGLNARATTSMRPRPPPPRAAHRMRRGYEGLRGNARTGRPRRGPQRRTQWQGARLRSAGAHQGTRLVLRGAPSARRSRAGQCRSLRQAPLRIRNLAQAVSAAPQRAQRGPRRSRGTPHRVAASRAQRGRGPTHAARAESDAVRAAARDGSTGARGAAAATTRRPPPRPPRGAPARCRHHQRALSARAAAWRVPRTARLPRRVLQQICSQTHADAARATHPHRRARRASGGGCAATTGLPSLWVFSSARFRGQLSTRQAA